MQTDFLSILERTCEMSIYPHQPSCFGCGLFQYTYEIWYGEHRPAREEGPQFNMVAASASVEENRHSSGRGGEISLCSRDSLVSDGRCPES